MMKRDKRWAEGWHTCWEPGSNTIRQMPRNYCLAIRRPDGVFFAAPDKASSINAHSLGIVLSQAEDQGITDPDEIADFIHHAFY